MWAEKWTIMQEASGSSTAPNADDSHNHYEIKLQQIISKRNTYWHSTPQNSAHTKYSEGVQRTNAKYHMVSLSTEQGRIVCVRACVVCCVCVCVCAYIIFGMYLIINWVYGPEPSSSETHHPTQRFWRLFLDLLLIGRRGCASAMGVIEFPPSDSNPKTIT